MKATRLVLIAASSVALFAGLGCAPHYAPPPPPVAALPPLLQEADHNGFETGRSDGAADVERGFPYAPRRTRAYHDTPGYDPRFGPFGPYRDAFRNAYLRGYDRGFHRG
jgi:hypothetical protein